MNKTEDFPLHYVLKKVIGEESYNAVQIRAKLLEK